MKFIEFGVCVLLLLVIPADVWAARTTQPAFASQPVEKDGLQVTICGDKTVFAKNEPIKFTVRFKNISDKQVSLQFADEFQDWIVRLEEVTSTMPWRLQGLSDEPRPARQTRILLPGEVVEVPTEWGSNRFPFRYESELILNMPIPPTDSLRPGRYRLWLGINFKRNPERAGAHMAFRGDINLGPVEIEISDKDDPTGIHMSEAVKENNAEFQTVTRPKWLIPAVGAKSEMQIGLRVTNHTGTWMQINVFDTVQVVLEDSKGTQLRYVKSRDATFIPEPLILQPRESKMIYRNATLEWSVDGKSLRLSGSDGAGGNWHFDDLKSGKYTVHCVYENGDERMKSVLNRPAKHVLDSKNATCWMGKVTSKDLAVELNDAPAEPTTRSFGPVVDDRLALLGIKHRKDDDALQLLTVGGRTILSITSPSGVGGATFERRGDQWPEALVLRLHLRGLEALSIVSGDTTLRASVTSHQGNPRLLQLDTGKTETRQLAKDDLYWTDIQTFDATGKPVNGLPAEGGWFEMTIPKALLAGQSKTLALEWIDFYR